ncbi:MAG: amidohydrolase family protein [Acidimicrobiia bacterium]
MVVVDAHQHFWDPQAADYPWMTDELAAIRRRFGPEDLRPLLDANGVDYSIFVQARHDAEETLDALALTRQVDFLAGVVGWVDLTDQAVAENLARVREEPGGEALVGIRHLVQDEPDPQWLLRPEVGRGLEAVAEADLTYDLLVRPPQFSAAVEAARRHSQLRLVLDHIGKPAIASGAVEPWATHMTALAELEHVACKLSGMVTEADWRSWIPSHLAPFVERVVAWFGEDRLLFGSDWPVCLLAASYHQVKAALDQLLAGASATARAKIYGENALRVYRLPVTGPRDRPHP